VGRCSPDLARSGEEAKQDQPTEVLEEVLAWQRRPLEALYPVIYLDALVVKVRDGAHVINKAAHLAVGVDMDGAKWTYYYLYSIIDIYSRYTVGWMVATREYCPGIKCPTAGVAA